MVKTSYFFRNYLQSETVQREDTHKGRTLNAGCERYWNGGSYLRSMEPETFKVICWEDEFELTSTCLKQTPLPSAMLCPGITERSGSSGRDQPMGNNCSLNRTEKSDTTPSLSGLLKRKDFPKLEILRWCLKDKYERAWEVDVGRKKRNISCEVKNSKNKTQKVTSSFGDIERWDRNSLEVGFGGWGWSQRTSHVMLTLPL